MVMLLGSLKIRSQLLFSQKGLKRLLDQCRQRRYAFAIYAGNRKIFFLHETHLLMGVYAWQIINFHLLSEEVLA